MATISQVTRLGEDGIRLAAGDLEAVVIPSAGMVVASLRLRGEELLGRADALAGWVDGGHTMGIPLLHPWANRLAGTRYEIDGVPIELDPASPLLHRDDNGLPIHGLLGSCRYWKSVSPMANDARAELTAVLDAEDVPGLIESFPFPHRLELALELRPELLSITTTLTARELAVPIAFGWHPYFQLPQAPRSAWELELPPMRALELDALQLPTGEEHAFEGFRTPLGTMTLDDGFGSIDSRAELSLSAGPRLITVSFDEGYAFGQVFAPPNQDVVALEPMTAPANALVTGRGLAFAAPGESHSARFSVHVR
ncbi:MAG: aldose 1-epimerase [Gaiellales bacterium]